MPTLTDLVAYCDQRTRRAAFKDAPAAFNGLQVANSGRARKIGAAVDAGVIPFQKAAAAGIDFLIVHHGMYWDMPRPLTGPFTNASPHSSAPIALSIPATFRSMPTRS